MFNEFLQQHRNLLIGVGIVVLLFVIYFGFFRGTGPDQVLVSDRGQGPQESEVGRELLNLLLELKAIELEASIFDNPAFQSLQDFSQEIVPQPVGRDNPFEPYSGIRTGN